jgi:hypothetical protein
MMLAFGYDPHELVVTSISILISTSVPFQIERATTCAIVSAVIEVK